MLDGARAAQLSGPRVEEVAQLANGLAVCVVSNKWGRGRVYRTAEVEHNAQLVMAIAASQCYRLSHHRCPKVAERPGRHLWGESYVVLGTHR